MKKVLFLLFIVFNCSGVNAQIMFKTEYFGTSAYRMMEGETDKKVGDSKGSAVVYQGGINIPISIKLNENNRPTMWAISLGGTYAKLENKWSMLIAIGGGIYMPCTKLSQIRYKNILGNIGAIFIYHLKPNLELGGGIAMNNSFGYPMIFPAIYFKWTTEGRFGVKIAMLEGIEMSAGYTINNNLNLNLVVEMNGQMALLEQNGKDKIFTHQYFVAGLRPEIKLGKHISIPITAGIHAMRPAEMVNRSLKSMFQDKGYYFQVSPYVSAGLLIGF